MNISVNKLLAKIEDELKQAKGAQKDEQLREKIYSIKILCELILDEKHETDANSESRQPIQQPYVQPQPVYQQQVFQQPVVQQPSVIGQPKKIDIDEANGDSLFDF